MNNANVSEIPVIVEHVLNSIEEKIKITGIKQFSDEDLLNLHSVYGVVLQRALDILEKYPYLETYSTTNKARRLIEVKGENNRCYRIFPNINYCPCPAFRHQVIERKCQITCKHVLVSRLACMLNKVVDREVTQDQYSMLVMSIFDLED